MSHRAGWRVGVGPVFVYEWLTSSRRWQGYALRAAFLLLLLSVLVVIWNSSLPFDTTSPIRMMAGFGEAFFVGVVGMQLTLVLLAAPAATAGAICLDRARGTLTHMLVTDLSNAEIVLGKLAARLVPVLGIVACTLPLMEILALMGGVDPDALLGAFVVTVGVAILGCSLALVFSLSVGKTHEALLGTYAVWGLWLLWRPIVGVARQWFPGLIAPPPLAADPFWLAFAPYWAPSAVTWDDYAWFLGVTAGISAILIGVAVLRVRAIVTRDVVKRAPAPSLLDRLRGRLAPGRYLPRPSLDWNPVFWREWHRSRPSRWARAVNTLYFGIAAFFSLTVVAMQSVQGAAMVNGLQVFAGLLLLSVTAAASLAEERVRGSLDVLMTTPLSTRQIVLGKWLGAYRTVPLLAVLPAIVVLGFTFNQENVLIAAPGFVAYVLCAGAAITSLGLAMATVFPRVGRAVAATVSVYVAVAVGWFFLVIMLRRHEPSAEMLLMGSPFVWALIMTMKAAEPLSGPPATVVASWAIIWTITLAFCSAALLVLVLTSFDRRLGRMEEASLRLMNGDVTPSERALWTSFVGMAVPATVAAMLADPRGMTVFLLNGALVSAGLLVAAIKVAISCGRLFERDAADRNARTGQSLLRIVIANWVGSCRAVALVALLGTLVVVGHWDSHTLSLTPILLVPIYIISAGMAWCGVAVVSGVWLPPRSAAIVTVAILSGVLVVVPLYGALTFNTGFALAAGMFSPFVATCAMTIDITSRPELHAYGAALAATLLYACATVVLLAAAAVAIERRLDRERIETGRPAPLSAT